MVELNSFRVQQSVAIIFKLFVGFRVKCFEDVSTSTCKYLVIFFADIYHLLCNTR